MATHSLDSQNVDSQNADYDYERRFAGVARLYGAQAAKTFAQSHIVVIGVGGVGSWVVEALARTAIGQLTLIDLDNVAESNVNRQIQATTPNMGKAKIIALQERVASINPLCQVHLVEDFMTPDNVAHLLPNEVDYVIDAMDDVSAKVALIHYGKLHHIPMITIGAAGGQTDPSKIEIRDLSRTEQEPLLALVRKRLRQKHGFPRGIKNKFHIDAIFSMEAVSLPESATENGEATNEESACELPIHETSPYMQGKQAKQSVTGLNCAGYGSSVVVTATFGFMAAAHVLNRLSGKK